MAIGRVGERHEREVDGAIRRLEVGGCERRRVVRHLSKATIAVVNRCGGRAVWMFAALRVDGVHVAVRHTHQ